MLRQRQSTDLCRTNVAPAFGPVLSGALTEKLGWRWIFWFLTITTAAYGLVLVLFDPETQRRLVGNGSKRVHGLLYRNLFSVVTSQGRYLEKDNLSPQTRRKIHIPNPFISLKMLFSRGNASVILFGGITYSVRMTLQAFLGAQCIEIYNLTYLQAGLVYLPAGVSGALGAKMGGFLIDRNYRRMCDKLDGFFRRGENISDFPIEKARLIGAYVMIVVTAVASAGYGLALMTRDVSPIPRGRAMSSSRN